jgi:hypothetical protein
MEIGSCKPLLLTESKITDLVIRKNQLIIANLLGFSNRWVEKNESDYC